MATEWKTNKQTHKQKPYPEKHVKSFWGNSHKQKSTSQKSTFTFNHWETQNAKGITYYSTNILVHKTAAMRKWSFLKQRGFGYMYEVITTGFISLPLSAGQTEEGHLLMCPIKTNAFVSVS